MSDVLHVNDENFDAEIIQSEVPVLVDFSATWCGPCKKLDPIVEELATEYKGRLKVAHVDVDEARTSAGKFGVMSVPTVLYIKAGEVQGGAQIGLVPKDKMVERISEML